MKKLLTAVALVATICATSANAQLDTNRKSGPRCTFNGCFDQCIKAGGPPSGAGSPLVARHCSDWCAWRCPERRS